VIVICNAGTKDQPGVMFHMIEDLFQQLSTRDANTFQVSDVLLLATQDGG